MVLQPQLLHFYISILNHLEFYIIPLTGIFQPFICYFRISCQIEEYQQGGGKCVVLFPVPSVLISHVFDIRTSLQETRRMVVAGRVKSG